ncbi:MAG: hypothetical protein LCH86_24000 [Proteobacteria bacterium]|nr:hypothetical protein [Pseudomonadota bacterium]
MTKLTGKVAILNAAKTAIVEVRNLGPVGTDVKPELVRQYVEVRPALGANQVHAGYSDLITATVATRTYTVVTLDVAALDMAALNTTLTSDGSVVRALGLVLFDAINQQNLVTLDAVNELRTTIRTLSPATQLSNYSVAQFKAALVAKGKTPFYTMDEFVGALQALMRA